MTGLWWHGREAIARPHDYALKSFFADTTLRIGRTETRYVGDDVAVVRARLHLSGQRAPDGQPAGDRQTILTAVLRREASGWLAISAQNTEVSPGMETHLAEGGTTRPVDYRR